MNSFMSDKMEDNKNEENENILKDKEELEERNIKFRSKTIVERLKQTRNLPKNINI